MQTNTALLLVGATIGFPFACLLAQTDCVVTAISVPSSLNGSLTTGDCHSPLQTNGTHFADRYSFSASSGAQIATLLTSPSFDTFLYLIDPSGAVLAMDDDGGGGRNSRIPPNTGFLTLPVSGVYTVEVTSFATSITGNYSLSLLDPSCMFIVESSNACFGIGGGSGTISVSDPSGCGWTVTTNGSCPWLTITTGTTVTGNGTVSYSVTSNPDEFGRSCTFNVAGQSFTVSQLGFHSCLSSSIGFTNQSVSAAGGSLSVNVFAETCCSWVASSGCGFATVAPTSGVGPGSVTITVSPNPSANPRSCTNNVAGQTFIVFQDGASTNGGNGLAVFILDENGAATDHFRMTAPTNAIDLSALVTGNTGTPTFQWCAENVTRVDTNLFGNPTNRNEIAFTGSTSSNTAAIFSFAGEYLLSVTASVGTNRASAVASVTLDLKPDALFTNIANLLNATDPTVSNNSGNFLSFYTFGNDAILASNYYAAIDPGDKKDTLAKWKFENGITTNAVIPPAAVSFSGVVAATYYNVLDLGFGRRMIMGGTASNRAFAVSNYKNVDEAINDTAGTNALATVTMDYSPVTNGGRPFIKFYVFGKDGNRVLKADLDGGGDKFVPGLCIACHGTQTQNPITNGDVNAHFLPFDLRAFGYSCSNQFTRQAQEPVFYLLNKGVYETETNFTADARKQALIDLLEGWYGGPGLPNPNQNADFVPLGWTTNQNPTAASNLYLHVVATNCRGCHVTRKPFQDFRNFEDFNQRAGTIRSFVFGAAPLEQTQVDAAQAANALHMPHARRTFERFWTSVSPRPQAELLRDFLLSGLANLSNVCPSTISSVATNFPASGGPGIVTVNVDPNCSSWTATSNDGFISVTSGAVGNGTGNVSFAVEANPDAAPRSGTLTIAGHTFTVTQDAAPFPAGDVNGDSHVTSADSLLINQVLVHLRGTNDLVFQAAGFLNGDVNQDNQVTSGDSLLINQQIVNLRAFVVTRIVPKVRSNNVPTPVTIFGIGFPTNTVTGVTIGAPVNLALSNVVVVSREQINAVVPAAGGIGTGTVNVTATPTNGVISFGRFNNQ